MNVSQGRIAFGLSDLLLKFLFITFIFTKRKSP